MSQSLSRFSGKQHLEMLERKLSNQNLLKLEAEHQKKSLQQFSKFQISSVNQKNSRQKTISEDSDFNTEPDSTNISNNPKLKMLGNKSESSLEDLKSQNNNTANENATDSSNNSLDARKISQSEEDLTNLRFEQYKTTKLIQTVKMIKQSITKQFPKLDGDHHVLVIGAHDVGKSSLINSLWLSMTGETEERAPPVGKPYNYASIPIYKRRAKYIHSKGITLKGGSLQFWDTRGFHKIYNLSLLATLFRFILEGRMPPSYFHQALMLDEKTIEKNCKKIEINRNNMYKAVVFVERENPSPETYSQTQKLAKGLQMGLSRSKFHAVKSIPIIRVKNFAQQEVSSLGKESLEKLFKREHSLDVIKNSQPAKLLGQGQSQPNVSNIPNTVIEETNKTTLFNAATEPKSICNQNQSSLPSKIIPQPYPSNSLSKATITSVSSCESLCEVGMPSRQHNIESYCWSVNYTEFDVEEIDKNRDQVTNRPNQRKSIQEDKIPEEPSQEEKATGSNETQEKERDEEDDENDKNETYDECATNDFILKWNAKPSQRFEFSYRLAPAVEELSPEKHLSLLLFLNNLLTIIVHPDGPESRKWRFNKDSVSISDQQISCTTILKNLMNVKNMSALSSINRRRTGN